MTDFLQNVIAWFASLVYNPHMMKILNEREKAMKYPITTGGKSYALSGTRKDWNEGVHIGLRK